MSDTITDEIQLAEHESKLAEKMLAKARASSQIMFRQVGTGWTPAAGKVEGVINTDPDSDPDISPPNAARGKGTGDSMSDILSQLDQIQKKIGDLLNSYIPKAKVNKSGTTKSVPVVAPSAGTRNAMRDPQIDQMKLDDAMWKHRKAYWESDADFQQRLQNKIAQLTAEHRKLGK
jgi:hypothetical protein